MQEKVNSETIPTPILFHIEPLQFRETIRQIIREEANNVETIRPVFI